jgi:hypothetical protein
MPKSPKTIQTAFRWYIPVNQHPSFPHYPHFYSQHHAFDGFFVDNSVDNCGKCGLLLRIFALSAKDASFDDEKTPKAAQKIPKIRFGV